MTDLAIEYKAKILEIKNNIEELQQLNIDCDKYVKMIEDIEVITEVQVNENCSKFKGFEPFLEDSLRSTYFKSIKELDNINYNLGCLYNNYYDIKLKYEQLDEKINSINASNIKELVDEVIVLLKELKLSPTINYQEKEYIIEKVYELVYKTIKLEISYIDNSYLFEVIKSDEIDASFIIQLIKTEIKNVSNNDQESASKILSFISDNCTSNESFLDKDLITLLNDNDKKNELISYQHKSILDFIDNYKNRLLSFFETYLNNRFKKKLAINDETDVVNNKKIFPLWLFTYNEEMLRPILNIVEQCIYFSSESLEDFVDDCMTKLDLEEFTPYFGCTPILTIKQEIYNNKCLLVYWDMKSLDAYEILTGIKIPIVLMDKNEYKKEDFFKKYDKQIYQVFKKSTDTEYLKKQSYIGIMCCNTLVASTINGPVDFFELNLQDHSNTLNLYNSTYSDLENFEKELKSTFDESKSWKEKIKLYALTYKCLCDRNVPKEYKYKYPLTDEIEKVVKYIEIEYIQYLEMIEHDEKIKSLS